MEDRQELNRNLAQMLKGGVIMDVTTPEQAKIAEAAGACGGCAGGAPRWYLLRSFALGRVGTFQTPGVRRKDDRRAPAGHRRTLPLDLALRIE